MPSTRTPVVYPPGDRHTSKFKTQPAVDSAATSFRNSSTHPNAFVNSHSDLLLEDPVWNSNSFEQPLDVNVHTSSHLTVMVVDDHAIVREGLTALINRHPDMRVVAEAADGRGAVQRYIEQRPTVALLDLRMPVMDGFAAVAAILQRDAFARLVVVTSYPGEEDVYRALRAGARGYILKDSSIDELIDCIRAVAAGETWIPSQIGAKLAKRLAYEPLTAREGEVLQAVAAGKSNKEIGNAFNISEATVKVHMTHILGKLRVTGRTEAINVALKRGLVHIEGVTAA